MMVSHFKIESLACEQSYSFYFLISEDEQIAPLPAKVELKSNWDDEDVDENEIKESWEDDDEEPAQVFLSFYSL